jgi:hypothetical protein
MCMAFAVAADSWLPTRSCVQALLLQEQTLMALRTRVIAVVAVAAVQYKGMPCCSTATSRCWQSSHYLQLQTLLAVAAVTVVLAAVAVQNSCAEMWYLARPVMLSTHKAVDKLDSAVLELWCMNANEHMCIVMPDLKEEQFVLSLSVLPVYWHTICSWHHAIVIYACTHTYARHIQRVVGSAMRCRICCSTVMAAVWYCI